MSEFKIYLAFLGILGGTLGSIFLISFGLIAYDCNGYERATGKPTKIVALECYVKDGNSWYSWEEYKHRLITKGELK